MIDSELLKGIINFNDVSDDVLASVAYHEACTADLLLMICEKPRCENLHFQVILNPEFRFYSEITSDTLSTIIANKVAKDCTLAQVVAHQNFKAYQIDSIIDHANSGDQVLGGLLVGNHKDNVTQAHLGKILGKKNISDQTLAQVVAHQRFSADQIDSIIGHANSGDQVFGKVLGNDYLHASSVTKDHLGEIISKNNISNQTLAQVVDHQRFSVYQASSVVEHKAFGEGCARVLKNKYDNESVYLKEKYSNHSRWSILNCVLFIAALAPIIWAAITFSVIEVGIVAGVVGFGMLLTQHFNQFRYNPKWKFIRALFGSIALGLLSSAMYLNPVFVYQPWMIALCIPILIYMVSGIREPIAMHQEHSNMMEKCELKFEQVIQNSDHVQSQVNGQIQDGVRAADFQQNNQLI